jgi:hypothetical protein
MMFSPLAESYKKETNDKGKLVLRPDGPSIIKADRAVPATVHFLRNDTEKTFPLFSCCKIATHDTLMLADVASKEIVVSPMDEATMHFFCGELLANAELWALAASMDFLLVSSELPYMPEHFMERGYSFVDNSKFEGLGRGWTGVTALYEEDKFSMSDLLNDLRFERQAYSEIAIDIAVSNWFGA